MNLKQLFSALGCQLATLLVATSAEALPESPEVSRAPPPSDVADAEIDWSAPSPNQPAVQREPPAQAAAKPVSTAVTTPPSCDVGVFDDVPDNCSTPRTGTVSNWYAALDIGMATLSLRALRTGSEWDRDPPWIFGSAWEFETRSLRIRRSAS